MQSPQHKPRGWIAIITPAPKAQNILTFVLKNQIAKLCVLFYLVAETY